MRFTRLILALTSFLILITQTDLFASTVLHKTSMVDLSNNAIICMHQDPDGYLWIGTYDGLNLYNGKDTYVYRFELNNKNSLCSNIIHKISDAEPGFLWISTSLGINKFSLKERKVTESFPGYMECDLLASDSSGITLAICKENRISCYTPSSDGFRDLPREGVGPQTVRTLFAGTDGHFYLLLASGILKKLTPDFSDTTFNLLSEERQFHNKPILSAFYENNHIFIVDTDNKLYRQHVDGKGKEFLFDLPEMTKQYGNIIKICTFQSNVYIVFRNGNILDLSQPENTINMGIGIFCLMNDKRQEILWLGTDGQGIRMFYDKPDLFGSILLKDLPINIQNPIRSLYTDDDQSLWLGTKGDGIVRIQAYDTYHNKKMIPQSAITHFTTADGLSSNRVYCFQKSEYHPCIWIGTEGPGLTYYSYKEKRIKTIPQREDTTPLRYVHSICEVDDSTLWLATTGNGLPKFKAGLQNTFTYKNFDFSFFLRGMFDYDVLNEGAIYFGTTVNIDQSGTNVYKDALKNKVTEQPLFSSYYLEKGNFLKIDNVTLGYTFNFKNNKYVRNLRIYGNVTNLATITGYSGLTPDVNVTGLQAGIEKRGSYPTTRTFTFGVNFGF